MCVEVRHQGEQVLAAVSDDGCGIAPDDLGRVFDPFFTTRQARTGLGLAIAHEIVRSHHGTIDVASRPGHGTRVKRLSE